MYFNVFEDDDESVPKKDSLWRRWRPAFFLDHLNYPSFRRVFPTFIHIWVTVIIATVNTSSNWIGSVGFMMQIVGFIMVVGDFLVVMNVILACVCLGYVMVVWVHTIVAMAITSRIRGWKSAQDYISDLIAEGTCTEANASTCFTKVVYTGRYLQTRCTAVWVIALIVGIVICGMSKLYHPLLRQGYVFSGIVIVILCTSGVMLPYFDPTTLPLQIIRPIGISLVVKVIVASVVFPSSSSYRFFAGSGSVLAQLARAHRGNARFIGSMKPTDPLFVRFRKLADAITPIRVQFGLLDVVASTVRLEVSFGRFDVGDVGQFRSHVKNLVSRSAQYEYFYQLFQERAQLAQHGGVPVARARTRTDADLKLAPELHHSYDVGQYESRAREQAVRTGFVSLHKVTPADLDRMARVIAADFAPVYAAANELLDAICNWLDAANEFRIYSLLRWRYHVDRQREESARVRRSAALLEDSLAAVVDPAARQERMRAASSTHESLLTFVSQHSMLVFVMQQQAAELGLLAAFCLELDHRRPKPQLIGPWTRSVHEPPTQTNGGGDPDDLADLADRAPEPRPRDPDHLPPRTWFQRVGRALGSFYCNTLLSRQLWLWVRVGGTVNICAIPYYCRTTAEWYYSNRLVWLPIICALSSSEYSAESMYIFASKFVYSFVGAVLGLVAWYVSAGNGHGNPYGYAAVTAVLYFILCFYRHFAVHMTAMASIIACITPTLVLGTSWTDSHAGAGAPNDIGWGVRPAVTRFISVVIGIAMAYLASSFPKPHSSKAAVRMALANAIDDIAVVHGRVSKFAFDRQQNPAVHAGQRHDAMAAQFRSILAVLARTKTLMQPIRYEVAVAGDWPRSHFVRLQSLVTDLVQLYFLQFSIIDQVNDPPKWMPIMMQRAGWTDADINTDVFAVSHMVSACLRTKDALPSVMRANISVRHLDLLRRLWGISSASLSERYYVEESQVLHNLDYNKLFSHDGQLNIVVLLVSHLIYERLDELTLVTKKLVGEKYDFASDLLFEKEE